MSCYVYSSRLLCIISCEMVRMKKETEPDRNQTAETTKALHFTPGLFIQGKHPNAPTHTQTLTLIIIPPHLFSSLHHYQFPPSSYNPLSLHLLSPFHYDLFTISPLSPPSFCLMTCHFPTTLLIFSPRPCPLSPFLSLSLLLFLYLFFAPTFCCHIKP